ncbi:MAG: EamA family transporter RarD [Gemmataceae bacterium]|nr:EamA family transporter RarD [Gemmataceae bacterium]
MSPTTQLRSGLLWGFLAYSWWGLVPLYFAVLKRYGLSAGEILAQRITWSLPLLLLLIGGMRGRQQLRRAVGDPSLLLTLAVSATLLAGNWLLYIYATVTDRVTEASLGYFMMPLVNAALATAVLRERLRPAHYPALALIAVAVLIPVVATGRFSWLAIALPLTFGLYSLVRKQAPVDSAVGLTVETFLLLPFSSGYLLWLASRGENHLTTSLTAAAWILFSSVVTVAPLLAFILSLRRLPLLTVSFLQFISPTVQMLIAVFVLGEVLDAARLASFGCVWLAVAIFLTDAVVAGRFARRRPPSSSPPVCGSASQRAGLSSAIDSVHLGADSPKASSARSVAASPLASPTPGTPVRPSH